MDYRHAGSERSFAAVQTGLPADLPAGWL